MIEIGEETRRRIPRTAAGVDETVNAEEARQRRGDAKKRYVASPFPSKSGLRPKVLLSSRRRSPGCEGYTESRSARPAAPTYRVQPVATFYLTVPTLTLQPARVHGRRCSRAERTRCKPPPLLFLPPLALTRSPPLVSVSRARSHRPPIFRHSVERVFLVAPAGLYRPSARLRRAGGIGGVWRPSRSGERERAAALARARPPATRVYTHVHTESRGPSYARESAFYVGSLHACKGLKSVAWRYGPLLQGVARGGASYRVTAIQATKSKYS